MDMLFITFSIFGIIPSVFTQPPVYSTELETSLRDELFSSNYSILQRPSKKVPVSISFTILTVNDLNIKDQTLTLSGYLTMVWTDSRLSWSDTTKTSQDYTSVNFLFSTEEYAWKPAVLIENAVNGISIISNPAIPMRITQNGVVIWNPADIYTVSCESDTRYYPMDTQECYLKLSSWAYTSTEIELFFRINPVDKTFYSENGEWDLLTLEGSKTETRARGGDSFSSISFLFRLQRRLMFHIVNTLFPVALMAILIAVVFKLPVDSGEKIGFSLTVLLSYAVYLTLISDNIPSTSMTVCYLSLYLAFILLLATIAVCCTTFVINLYMRPDDEEIPDWVTKLTFKYLARLACWKQTCRCGRNKVKDCPEPDKNTTNVVTLPEKSSDERKLSITDGESRQTTWKELSQIMDQLFFNLYMVLISLSTATLFLVIIVGHYIQS